MAAAAPTRAKVRSPAGEPRTSRSKPKRKARAKPTRTRMNRSVSLGTLPVSRNGDLAAGDVVLRVMPWVAPAPGQAASCGCFFGPAGRLSAVAEEEGMAQSAGLHEPADSLDEATIDHHR